MFRCFCFLLYYLLGFHARLPHSHLFSTPFSFARTMAQHNPAKGPKSLCNFAFLGVCVRFTLGLEYVYQKVALHHRMGDPLGQPTAIGIMICELTIDTMMGVRHVAPPDSDALCMISACTVSFRDVKWKRDMRFSKVGRVGKISRHKNSLRVLAV